MAITFRAANTSDLPALVELFRARDGHAHAAAAVAGYVCNLDSNRCNAWLAFDGSRPVGMSMVYRRRVRVGGKDHVAGYWGNLFVLPEYRKKMVYPKLPLTMFRDSRALGIEFVFTCSRRGESSSVHRALGCAELGKLPVLMKPLRPAALLAAHKRWPEPARLVARAPDALFGAGLRILAAPGKWRTNVELLAPESRDLAGLLDLREANAGMRPHDRWTLEEYQERYSHSLEGDRYEVLAARANERVVASVVWRPAVRQSMRLGVLMDLVCAPGHERALRAVIARAELRARSNGAQAMLHLDGGVAREALKRLGYIRSPETYLMLAFPHDFPEIQKGALDAQAWYFSFADHDAV
ncbi:MAG: GNAT family N-acetyltransferase [Myxococcota bacterium]